MASNGLICVGVIAGVHGVRGMVKLQSFTEPRTAIAGYKIVDAAGKALDLEIVSPPTGHILGKLKGFADRTQAEALKGTRLYIERRSLPAPADGEFYHSDLIGMDVISHDNNLVGSVRAVENFGSCDLLDIKGHECPDFLIPFTEGFVPEVDLDKRRIVLAYYEET